MSFKQQLSWGQTGESIISQFLQRRGLTILPVYETIIDSGKGPQLFALDGKLIAPDMLAFSSGKTFWVESKRKSAFTWHRLTERWCTGIDLRHYTNYIKVSERTPWPIWIMFLQGFEIAKDTPPGLVPPASGLYCNNLEILQKCESHRWEEGKMVYWCVDKLKFLASTKDLAAIDNKFISCSIPDNTTTHTVPNQSQAI